MIATSLYCPPDIFEANEAWGANCGPCAIAALSGKTVGEVRHALASFRGHMNTTEVAAALRSLGYQVARLKDAALVHRGCAHIMFDGPWSAGGGRAQYAHSHWVCYHRSTVLWLYDMNAGEAGGWLPLARWEAEVLPEMLPKRGTGYHFNVFMEASR